ncbi:peptidyl-prolyl cis-trans isomerase B (cyclophilin B) [Fibrella aestuarina BUZ 2]|uniref:Peptidyl-prolyl cis-trans isomerase n=1 Tax=Fibrella aestuarina BUZ 2 TaxID=1166018 RepID=I0K5F8_9BACT|nr:peptidylprolyl isomerase [Fibrella aestuarina]CCG99361.1 peptidyl-prolyl cis-trans isomerase B (cyclophilin B) [Fibrella aestuarina BUZ 2]
MRPLLISIALLLASVAVGQNTRKKDYLVEIKTDLGKMHLILFEQTPKHRDNFIKLVKDGYYNNVLFHRVIDKFMIQGGDPDSKTAVAGQALGSGDAGYTIPAEFLPTLFHRKGAIAAARDNNPQKASSGAQFYIVQGRVWNDEDLQKQIDRGHTRAPERIYTDEQKQVYKTLGGTPHLDGSYTVFGQLLDGYDVVDAIARQPRDAKDRPLKDIRMQVKGKWVRKKKITKLYEYTYEP